MTGQIGDPTPDNALLERLGDDLRFTTTYNGQEYRVFERRFSVLAEKSGELLIPSASFRGNLIKPQSRQGVQRRTDPFSQFFSSSQVGKGQPISIRSEPLQLVIEPHPPVFDGQQWLPAEQLSLHDSWSDKPPVMRVGEPVSRTITIEARGLVASQIQPLELPDISSFRRYGEPPENQTRTDGQTVYATSRRTFTYIPAFAGEQEIPALKLNWWNVLTDQQASATLPPWQFRVQPGIDGQATTAAPSTATSPATTTAPTSGAQPGAETSMAQPKPAADGIIASISSAISNWLIPIAIALLVLIGLFLWIARRQPGSRDLGNGQARPASAANDLAAHSTTGSGGDASPGAVVMTDNQRQLLKAFTRACEQHDASAAAGILLDLAKLTWPDNPPRSIGALATRVSRDAELLRELDQYLYAGTSQQWQGAELCAAFAEGLPVAQQAETAREALKPLYPDNAKQ